MATSTTPGKQKRVTVYDSQVQPGLYVNHVIWAWLSFQLSWIMLYCASFESYIRQNFGFFLLSGLLVGRGKKSQISRDFQGQIRGKNGRFRGNFRGQFRWKWLVKNGRLRESFSSKFRWKAIGFALIWGMFSMKLDAFIALLRLHTAIWNCTLQVSSLNIIKTIKESGY